MTWLAGETITAARLSQDSDEVALASTDASSSQNNWVALGAETLTFSNPGVAVKVKAWTTGRVIRSATTAALAQEKVLISLDGGTTFTEGVITPINAGDVAGANRRAGISAMHHRAGTPTGDVIIKAECQTDTADATTFSFHTLMAEIVPQ